jgi:hypothetical protein
MHWHCQWHAPSHHSSTINLTKLTEVLKLQVTYVTARAASWDLGELQVEGHIMIFVSTQARVSSPSPGPSPSPT